MLGDIMIKTLYLMRHGETLFNVQGKIQGWCDSPLTPNGIRQARAAAEYFRKRKIEFDAAYCSTAERASDTLELITPMPYTRLKGIREVGFGVFEGEHEYLHPSREKRHAGYYKPFGGEDENDVRERTVRTLLEVMNREGNNTVLAVSHAGACSNFLSAWQDPSTVLKGRVPNCAVFRYDFDTETQRFTLRELVDPVNMNEE